MGRVEGKVSIITGAGSGIGAATAQRLGEEGAIVVLTDVNAEAGTKVAAGIPNAIFLQQDVRSEERWIEVVTETVARFGRLDVLINNAGLVRFADVETSSLEEFRFVLAVMLEGPFLGCKHAIPAMARSGGGSIINVASTAAMCGYSAVPAYSAAKGGILSLTRSVAVHCQEQANGIRCNVVVPGATDTPMAVAASTAGESRGSEQSVAMGVGTPRQVANMMLFLASDESSRVNGAPLIVDGGETMR